MSSTHLPVDAWAAPALTVVTMLLNAVCKRLLERPTPLLGGRPTVKGRGFPGGSDGKESACIHFVGRVPTSGPAGSRGNSVRNSRGTSSRPFTAAAAFAGPQRCTGAPGPHPCHAGPQRCTEAPGPRPRHPRAGLLCVAVIVMGVRWVLMWLFFLSFHVALICVSLMISDLYLP